MANLAFVNSTPSVGVVANTETNLISAFTVLQFVDVEVDKNESVLNLLQSYQSIYFSFSDAMQKTTILLRLIFTLLAVFSKAESDKRSCLRSRYCDDAAPLTVDLIHSDSITGFPFCFSNFFARCATFSSSHLKLEI